MTKVSCLDLLGWEFSCCRDRKASWARHNNLPVQRDTKEEKELDFCVFYLPSIYLQVSTSPIACNSDSMIYTAGDRIGFLI